MSKRDAIKNLLGILKPWGLIDANEFTGIDDTGASIDDFLGINTTGQGLLAEQCKITDIHFMHFSTDIAFIGNNELHSIEPNEVCTVKMYGKITRIF